MHLKSLTGFFIFMVLISISCTQERIPFKVHPLFNLQDSVRLGLEYAQDIETTTVFSPGVQENKYNHGAVLFSFKEKLYVQWQSSSVDEDGPDTRVFYSTSNSGREWAVPEALTEIRDQEITTSGGWWSDGQQLIAFINVWENNGNQVKQGHSEYMSTTDGIHWTEARQVLDNSGFPVNGIIEQDMKRLPSGRILTAFHMQPGLHATPYYTENPLAIAGWKAGLFHHLTTNNQDMSRELEPSWFLRNDGSIVMIFRDQHSTFKKLASLSEDNGNSWTPPVIIETPDSRSKQSAGNLPDGTAYMVNNPSGNKKRYPLVITLSKDGFLFDRAFLLRDGGEDLRLMRFAGRYKRPGYSYPKSYVWKKYLYVAYATNKEVVEVTRVPLSSISQH